MGQESKAFTSRMKRWQYLVVLLYLPAHIFGLPLLLLAIYDRGLLSLGMVNFWAYAAGAIFLVLVLWRFLRQELDPFLDTPFRSLLEIARGFLWLWCAESAVVILMALFGITEDSANNAQAVELLRTERGPVVAATVFLGPIVEECLFRGGLFGVLRRRNRLLAYAVSALLFGLYHVSDAALSDPRELIYLLEYVPAGLILASCYERTDSLWSSIFLHMLNNGVAYWTFVHG